MSAATVESILTRAMSDHAFAEQLLTNPENALSGFDLTGDEMANFKALSRADFNKLTAASPDERKSFTAMNHNQIMLRLRSESDAEGESNYVCCLY